jgi:hypothetical protein
VVDVAFRKQMPRLWAAGSIPWRPMVHFIRCFKTRRLLHSVCRVNPTKGYNQSTCEVLAVGMDSGCGVAV